MPGSIRGLVLFVTLAAAVVTAACETAEERDARVATEEAFTADRNEDSTQPAVTAEPSPVPSPGGAVVQSFSRAVGASSVSTTSGDAEISTPIPTVAPTAQVLETPEPTSTPAPTATPVPTPTATAAPMTGPWSTALKAMELASAAQLGVVKGITGHVSRRGGEQDVGDTSNTVASPGPGYSSGWAVTILDGDQPYLCVVKGQSVECSILFSAGPGDVEDAAVDSPAFFGVWDDNSDWDTLMSQDEISILLQLARESESGLLAWSAFVTVHGATEAPYGGNFKWTPATGDTSFNTY